MLVLRSILVFFLIFAVNALGDGPQFKREKTRISRLLDTELRYDLNSLLKASSDTTPVTWRTSPLPAWLTFVPNTGKITGRMPSENFSHWYRVEARQGDKVAEAQIQITADRQARWNNGQIDLGKIHANKPFTFDLKPQIWNEDLVSVSVEAKHLPAWMQWNPDTLTLSGTPPVDTKGRFESIRLLLAGVAAPASVSFEVLAPARVPVISPRVVGDPASVVVAHSGSVARGPFTLDSDVVKLTSLMYGKQFDYNLTDNVKYTGTGAVVYSFRKKGPAWFSLTPDGKLSGKPDTAGNFIAVVLIGDGTNETELVLDVAVADDDQAPIINHAGLSFDVAEREEKVFDLTPLVSQLGSKPLTYRLTSVYGWASLSPDGKKLKLAPLYAQVGNASLNLEVSNGVNRAAAKVTVKVAANPQKPVWDVLVRVNGKVGTNLVADISKAARDLDGRPLEFSKQGGSRWFGITAEGKVFGLVEEPTGEQTFTVRASNGTLSADKDIVVTVTRDNRPPVWNVAEITLKNARALEDYAATINDAKWVADPDGDALTFSWASGIKWAGVKADGSISGKPSKAQVGPGSLLVKATDAKGLSAQVTVNIQVDPANAPPKWSTDAIYSLGEIPIGKALNYDLLSKASDPEEEALSFRKVSGPAWLTVDAAGALGGAPLAGQRLGPFNAKVAVSDGRSEVEAAFVGSVVPPNNPPVIDPAGLAFDIEERRTYTVDLNRPGFVTDADGDKLTFSLDSRASFVEISPTGTLTIRAGFADIGAKTVKFSVTDGKDKASASIAFTVVRVPRPPRWKGQRVTLGAPAGVPFTGSLVDYVEDLDKLPLNFSRNKKFGPAWLNVDADGRIWGTPTDADVGENNFIVIATNDKLSADGALTINITSDNNPPRWKLPVTLPPGKAGVTYFQSLKDFAVDPDEEDFLTFTILTDPVTGKSLAPEWADLTKQGRVFGSPLESHVGPNSIMVRATDSRGAFADARANISITSQNNAPVWPAVVLLGTIKVGQKFTFDLNRLASDPDGEELQYKKLEGPAGMNVSNDGQVVWTPTNNDVGPFAGVFQASDGKAFSSVDFSGSVGTAAKPPVIHGEKLAFSVVPGQEFNLNLADSTYVENPDGGTLVFKLLSTLPWVDLKADGSLKLKPPASQKGKSVITFLVVNSGGASAQGDIQITLDAAIEAPRWIQDVEYTAQIGSTFTGDLNDFAQDLKKLPLTFRKVSGPVWLTVNPNGKLTGRPTAEMSREPQVFTVSADNGFKSADAPMTINVVAATSGPGPTRGPKVDVYGLNVMRPGAPIDLVFVLDHNAKTERYYQEMKRNAGAFFTKLDRAQIRYSVAVLSAREFLGKPELDGNNSIRITSSSAYANSDFGRMIDKTFAGVTYNSPIWALDRFFVDLTQKAEYRNDFYLETVPVLVMAHAFHADTYRFLAKDTSAADADPARVGRGFLNFHTKLRKPFHLYVKDNTCEPDSARDYLSLAASAGGTSVVSTPCQAPFDDWLENFGDLAIERAVRYNVRKLSLSAKPAKIESLKVFLRHGNKDTQLTGNTVADSDQWHYEATTNSVVLHWWNIRLAPDRADEIVVEY